MICNTTSEKLSAYLDDELIDVDAIAVRSTCLAVTTAVCSCKLAAVGELCGVQISHGRISAKLGVDRTSVPPRM